MTAKWDSVMYHPDWRYLECGHGRYVVKRERKRSRMWIITLNGERRHENLTFQTRDAAMRMVETEVGGPNAQAGTNAQ